jgi:hypothetical protein
MQKGFCFYLKIVDGHCLEETNFSKTYDVLEIAFSFYGFSRFVYHLYVFHFGNFIRNSTQAATMIKKFNKVDTKDVIFYG